MPNNYYNRVGDFIPFTRARSGEIDNELNGVVAGFDLLPDQPASIATGTFAFAGTDTGTADAKAVAMPNTRLANADGDLVVFRNAVTNTGAVTLNVDTLGAVPLRRADGSALVAGDLQADRLYEARYNATTMRFQLIGPSTSYLTAVSASAAAALASEGAAATSAGNASTSETNAAASEAAALISQTAAEDWAIRAEDDPVPPASGGDGATTYSAFHWAQKSAGSSGLPLASVNQTLYYDGGAWAATDAVSVDPAAGVTVDYNALPALATVATGIDVQSTTGTTVEVNLRTSGGSLVAVLGQGGFRSEFNGAIVTLEGFDIGGTTQPVFTGDPDTFARLYYNGDIKIETQADGTNFRGSSVNALGGSQTVFLSMQNANGVEVGYVGFNNDNGMRLQNLNSGGEVIIAARDAAGFSRNILNADPDSDTFIYADNDLSIRVNVGAENALLAEANGGVTTYFNALRATASAAFGIQVFDTSGANPGVELLDDAAARVGLLQQTGPRLVLRNSVAGFGPVTLEGRNTGDTVDRFVFNGDPDGAASLYHLGVETAKTRASGLQIGAATPIFEFQNAAFDTRLGYIHMNAGTSLQMRSEVDGDPLQFQGADAGGVVRNLFLGDPDGAVELFHTGTSVFATTSTGFDVSAASTPLAHIARTGTGHTTVAQANGGLLLSSGGMNTTSQYTPALWFGSTDSSFTTTNPKKLAAIAGRATQTYSGDTTGGMALDFFIMAGTPGATPDPERRLTLSGTRAEFIGIDDFDINHSASADAAGLTLRNSEGGIKLTVNGDAASLNQTNASGTTEDIWMLFNNNADVVLYNNGVSEFGTQDSNANYNTSGAQVKDHGGTFRDVGFNVAPLSAISTATTLSENHTGRVIQKSSGGAVTFTLPSGSSGTVPPIGAMIIIANEDTEDLTISASGTLRFFDGGGGTPPTGNRTVAEAGVCTVYHYASTEWWIWGAGIT